MEDPTNLESGELWIHILDRKPRETTWMTNSFGVDKDRHLTIIYTFKIYLEDEDGIGVFISSDQKEKEQVSA